MEKLVKVVCVVALAFVCMGFAHKEYVAHTTQYETVVYHERVHAGDTFNGIIEKYYTENEGSWDDFQTRMKQRNKALFFYKNGKPRWLAPSDVVCIECRVKK